MGKSSQFFSERMDDSIDSGILSIFHANQQLKNSISGPALSPNKKDRFFLSHFGRC